MTEITVKLDVESMRIPWIVDHSFRFTRAEGSWMDFVGRSAEEALTRGGRSMDEFVKCEDLGIAQTSSDSTGPKQRWFAWYPVRLYNAGPLSGARGPRVWLRTVIRQRHKCRGDGEYYWDYTKI